MLFISPRFSCRRECTKGASLELRRYYSSSLYVYQLFHFRCESLIGYVSTKGVERSPVFPQHLGGAMPSHSLCHDEACHSFTSFSLRLLRLLVIGAFAERDRPSHDLSRRSPFEHHRFTDGDYCLPVRLGIIRPVLAITEVLLSHFSP